MPKPIFIIRIPQTVPIKYVLVEQYLKNYLKDDYYCFFTRENMKSIKFEMFNAEDADSKKIKEIKKMIKKRINAKNNPKPR